MDIRYKRPHEDIGPVSTPSVSGRGDGRVVAELGGAGGAGFRVVPIVHSRAPSCVMLSVRVLLFPLHLNFRKLLLLCVRAAVFETAGIRGHRAVRNLLRHSAPEGHGLATLVLQDVQEQIPLHVPLQVVPYEPQEQMSDLSANMGVTCSLPAFICSWRAGVNQVRDLLLEWGSGLSDSGVCVCVCVCTFLADDCLDVNDVCRCTGSIGLQGEDVSGVRYI